jgi:hypothetical protein
MIPHSLKPTRRCRHPEVETDQETEGYLRRARFLAEVEYQDFTSEELLRQ